ncbi:hypothetical protein [Aquicella lusitana]|uniref:Uncharacterized protein n=1 Tax=Aquicella lusitana TaxID=254246 RepID=A0A370G525_9COXI|nr:hypothetical protein [Aquicella lusitana]RDI37153.1 hypothetical protein C8D86_1435 [Aquicella lusitana]VVC72553.1 hypothetical protein AQULUS_02650 [Aquicella lusitana]
MHTRSAQLSASSGIDQSVLQQTLKDINNQIVKLNELQAKAARLTPGQITSFALVAFMWLGMEIFEKYMTNGSSGQEKIMEDLFQICAFYFVTFYVHDNKTDTACSDYPPYFLDCNTPSDDYTHPRCQAIRNNFCEVLSAYKGESIEANRKSWGISSASQALGIVIFATILFKMFNRLQNREELTLSDCLTPEALDELKQFGSELGVLFTPSMKIADAKLWLSDKKMEIYSLIMPTLAGTVQSSPISARRSNNNSASIEDTIVEIASKEIDLLLKEKNCNKK